LHFHVSDALFAIGEVRLGGKSRNNNGEREKERKREREREREREMRERERERDTYGIRQRSCMGVSREAGGSHKQWGRCEK
jgi:hypothetical protein